MKNLNLPETRRGKLMADVVLGVLAASFFAALFNHGLVPSMEPRFAEVVREMMAAGEYVIPLKNGVPYVEYPVFYYWLAIAGKSLGLPMTAAIRLPTFLAFLGWLLILGRWQRYLPTNLPVWEYCLAAAALPLVLFQFSIAQTDGLLVFGVMLSMYGYTRLIEDPNSTGFPSALWVGAAVATLAKGPVGIACTLPVMFLDRLIVGWSVAKQHDSVGVVDTLSSIAASMLPMCWIRGVALVLVVSVPWYVLAGFERGWQFVHAVLVYQNFDRYVTGYSHSQPWWYFFKTIIYDFFPLSLFLPLGIWLAAKRIAEPVVRFSLLWVLYTFLFFTASGSKQGKYLLPMAPAIVALSLMALEYVWQQHGRNLWRWVRYWNMTLIVLFASLMMLVVPRFSDRIGGAEGFLPIRAQLDKKPGRLIHFQWPRSLTLYELGVPMRFVRSARELYGGIGSGEVLPGDYILVQKDLIGNEVIPGAALMLVPFPRPSVFEVVLETEIGKPVLLLRVLPGAAEIAMPDTPEPLILNWRDSMFDTD